MRLPIILFDLLLVYLICGHYLIRKCYPRSWRLKASLHDYERHFAHLLLRDRDVLAAR